MSEGGTRRAWAGARARLARCLPTCRPLPDWPDLGHASNSRGTPATRCTVCSFPLAQLPGQGPPLHARRPARALQPGLLRGHHVHHHPGRRPAVQHLQVSRRLQQAAEAAGLGEPAREPAAAAAGSGASGWARLVGAPWRWRGAPAASPAGMPGPPAPQAPLLRSRPAAALLRSGAVSTPPLPHPTPPHPPSSFITICMRGTPALLPPSASVCSVGLILSAPLPPTPHPEHTPARQLCPAPPRACPAPAAGACWSRCTAPACLRPARHPHDCYTLVALTRQAAFHPLRPLNRTGFQQAEPATRARAACLAPALAAAVTCASGAPHVDRPQPPDRLMRKPRHAGEASRTAQAHWHRVRLRHTGIAYG